MTEEKYTIRKYKRIIFYVVILVLLAAFFLGQRIYPSEREPVTEESITFTGTFCRDLIKGTAKHYKLSLIGLVAAMIAVMLEVTAVYRVVSLSGIFIAIGLVVLLVVTLIQTMDHIRELELARQREARESLDYLTGLPLRHKGEALILEKMQKQR